MNTTPDFEQIALGLVLPGASSFDDFWPGPNLEIVAHLPRVLRASGFQGVYLWGSLGTGKTHLLHACCNTSSGRAGYLPLAEIAGQGPRVLENIEALDCVCIDDVHLVAGQADWEQALFSCFNRVRDAGRKLIVSAAAAPRELSVAREDLLSRLAWGLVYRLRAPDDAGKAEALGFLCAQRGMYAAPAVIEYLLRRMPRTMNEIAAVVARLDAASLQAQRRLSIPFIKEVLKI